MSRADHLSGAVNADDPDERDYHARQYAQLTIAAVYPDDDGARSAARTDGGQLADVTPDSELPDPIRVTEHAETRWRQRTDDAVPVRVAWFEATPLDVEDDRADELRYHDPTDRVFAREGADLTTILYADSARPAIRDAIAALGGESA